MTLPIDLVLVRHGQSEGNLAKRLSEAGDHNAFTEEFRNRHSSSFHLTALGREQAGDGERFMRQLMRDEGIVFDRYVTSECIRAIETATILLPNAQWWYTEPYLTERNWGDMDICPEDERREKFGAELARRKVEPYFWQPPNGESFMQLCLRMDRVLDTLHRTRSKRPKIFVCHGEVMLALDVRITRMSQERFRELVFPERNEDRIYNCQIVHYTRRDPFHPTRPPLPYMGWKRWFRPTEKPVTTSGWQPIVRPRYSNAELLEIVNRTPAMVE